MTEGGILIPDTGKEKPMSGVVKAVGGFKYTEDGSTITPDYRLKDEILFGKYSGVEINLDNVVYLILDESDILGKKN